MVTYVADKNGYRAKTTIESVEQAPVPLLGISPQLVQSLVG